MPQALVFSSEEKREREGGGREGGEGRERKKRSLPGDQSYHILPSCVTPRLKMKLPNTSSIGSENDHSDMTDFPPSGEMIHCFGNTSQMSELDISSSPSTPSAVDCLCFSFLCLSDQLSWAQCCRSNFESQSNEPLRVIGWMRIIIPPPTAAGDDSIQVVSPLLPSLPSWFHRMSTDLAPSFQRCVPGPRAASHPLHRSRHGIEDVS